MHYLKIPAAIVTDQAVNTLHFTQVSDTETCILPHLQTTVYETNPAAKIPVPW